MADLHGQTVQLPGSIVPKPECFVHFGRDSRILSTITWGFLAEVAIIDPDLYKEQVKQVDHCEGQVVFPMALFKPAKPVDISWTYPWRIPR